MKLYKIAKILFFTFFILIGVALSLGLWFGHPNDRRLSPVDFSTLSPQHQYEKRIFRLFDPANNFQLSISQDAYKAHTEKLKQLPETGSWFQSESERFHSPFQVFISAGSHPDKLEGRTSVMIPAGESLTFRPGIKGRVRLELGALSLGDSNTLDVSASGRHIKSWKTERKSPPRDNDDFWYKNIGRYLKPDAPVPGGSWQYLSAGYQAIADHNLKITCKGVQGYCVISEPQIWQHTIETKPNLLFILVDTMRKDALDDPVSSPFMSQFSQNHIRFTNHLSAGNMTSPSTNSLLSCRKPSSLGNLAFSYSLNQHEKDAYYKQKKDSFPAQFRDHGWQTAMIGNISVISEVMGVAVDHGFEQQMSVERPGYDTAQISREAINWLHLNGQKPFFLYLHFHAPHAPYRAPIKDIIDTFPGVAAFSSYPNIIRWLYKGEIRHTDRYVRQVMDALKTLKLDESTTVVLTADHGDHHEIRHFIDNEAGHDFSGTYFDHGATLFHDEINVPFVVKPAHSHRQKTIETLVSGLDSGPTVLDMFDIPVPDWCEGQSLKPLFSDQPSETALKQLQERTIGFEGFNRRGILFSQRYKYIRQYSAVEKKIYPDRSFKGQMVNYFSEELLFDLKEDPGETNNLVYQNQSLWKKAQKIYQQYYQPKATYELVLENPDLLPVEIQTDASVGFNFSETEGELIKKRKKLIFKLKPAPRYRWMIPSPPSDLPMIRVGGKPVDIRLSSLRLPLSFGSLGKLVPESKELSHSLSSPKSTAAWIRKIEAHGVHNRQIRAGNPTFEKLLKEWGYLNDNT